MTFATRHETDEGGWKPAIGLRALAVSLLLTVVVAIATFLAGGPDVFRWRDRNAGTVGVAGQQLQYLPSRETLRAVISPERKDPPQTHWGTDGALAGQAYAFVFEHKRGSDGPLIAVCIRTACLPHGFQPRAPPELVI